MNTKKQVINGDIEILIVEDSPTQALQLQHILEQEGFQTLVAKNGMQALAILVEHKPTIIISDVMMPEMDGYLFCQQVKSTESMKHIPVILLTALSSSQDIIKGLECGADNFIVKPYNEKELLTRINFILLNKELRHTELAQFGVEVFFKGQKYLINSERQQILSMLLSSYETAVEKNNELSKAQEELKIMNEQLEQKVKQRTMALEAEIFERIRMEAEKERMQAELLQAQKLESIGQLAGGIAHDFNNLLVIIQGYSELLKSKMDKSTTWYYYMEQIHDASLRATNLVRQLLLFSRKHMMQYEALDLKKTIEDILKLLKRIIGEDIDVITGVENNLWQIKADKGNIEQVIMNLAVNARDAMSNGGTLTIRAENVTLDAAACKCVPESRPGEFACLSIEDTGSGMDTNTLQHIFEPFFTTKDTAKGTGLGLSVVYGIVKQHEGWINVKSEPGKGSTFHIFLPRLVDKDKREELILVSQPLHDLHGNGERILLVEDESEVRSFTSEALNDNGYVVFEAANAGEARDVFEKENMNFHLILADSVLPGTRGLQLVEQLLALKSDLRIIITSGYLEEASEWSALQERGFRFLQKPYSITDLFSKVKDTLLHK
ncbi:MAG: hypothetical protein A2Y62_02805 [Candidatus Fischerbacteria bacterium RBG_13_37_8]|uniref:histidine kinase n=1 Tax=Candidatus Fischerbacteria bacterium RBG_13_37_8 TaxID=1817863 RepID=A0A1F5VXW0_9BACT|nr:MAG: hypothetical protein A2Y62_02805 [Candidatus Fischerbacteria bacterium RBG_13_37_8]